jgi:type II secretion system protein L
MRLAGVEMGERELRIARAERRFGRTRLVGLERVALDDASALRRLAAWQPHAVLTACPAAAVTHRVLRLPLGTRARVLRAAPLELLGQLPIDPEGVAIACEPLGNVPGGTAVLGVVVRHTDLDAATAPLAAQGLAPARVDLAPLPVWNLLPRDPADLALLVADGERSTLTVRRSGRLAALRALAADAREPAALAAEARWSLAALGGVPARIVLGGADGGERLAVELAAATGAHVIPLAETARVDGAYEPAALAAGSVAAGLVLGFGERHRLGIALAGAGEVTPGSYRRIAALAVAALLLVCLDVGIMRVGLARRDAALTQAIHAEAALALPGERLVAPRAQLEAAAGAAARRQRRFGADASVLESLRELSTRVPPGLRLDLDELAIDDDGIALHGRCDSFDAVDAVRRALAASALFADVTAEETRTTVDGRRVEFRLRAARRANTGASS